MFANCNIPRYLCWSSPTKRASTQQKYLDVGNIAQWCNRFLGKKQGGERELEARIFNAPIHLIHPRLNRCVVCSLMVSQLAPDFGNQCRFRIISFWLKTQSLEKSPKKLHRRVRLYKQILHRHPLFLLATASQQSGCKAFVSSLLVSKVFQP